MIKISPSILTADFTLLGQTIRDLEEAGADYIHMDVMDGSFVPQITFGAKMVQDIQKVSRIPLDVHLMIQSPEKHIDDFIDAGSDILTIHYESTDQVSETLQRIRERGVRPAISIKPATAVDDIREYLPLVNMVLVMTVEPGYGGQSLIPEALDKVKELREIASTENYTYDIEVDGGINASTYQDAVAAGANVLVAGSAIINAASYTEAIQALKAVPCTP